MEDVQSSTCQPTASYLKDSVEMQTVTEKDTLPSELQTSCETTATEMPSPLSISRDRLMVVRSQSSSSMNFAVRLLRELCSTEELLGKNIAGVRGKEAVDANKVEVVKSLVKKFYPAPPCEAEKIWNACHKAMDSFLRKIPRPK